MFYVLLQFYEIGELIMGTKSISLARKRLLYMSIITNVMVCWSFWEESKSERECQFLEMLFIALCS